MPGKILVLCNESYNIDKDGDFVDKNGEKVIRVGEGKYIDIKWKQIDINEDKKIINTMDLTYPTIQKSVQDSEIILADWKTIVPSNMIALDEIKLCSQTHNQIPLELIFDSGYNSSIMRNVYADVLINQNRPITNFSFVAYEKFIQVFVEALKRNKINVILPSYSKDDEPPEVIVEREKLLNLLKNKKVNEVSSISILPYFSYKDFNDLMGIIKKHTKSEILVALDDEVRG